MYFTKHPVKGGQSLMNRIEHIVRKNGFNIDDDRMIEQFIFVPITVSKSQNYITTTGDAL